MVLLAVNNHKGKLTMVQTKISPRNMVQEMPKLVAKLILVELTTLGLRGKI
jgi:hypothetical protein